MGKKVPLLKILAAPGVEIVDGLFKIYVVPRGKAEGWAKEFKERKKKKV